MSVQGSRIVIAIKDDVKPMVYFLNSKNKRLNEGYIKVPINATIGELITMLNKAKKQAWNEKINKIQGVLEI